MIRVQDWRPRSPGFESCWRHFASELWQFRLTPFCQRLSKETVKVIGAYMPGEVRGGGVNA